MSAIALLKIINDKDVGSLHPWFWSPKQNKKCFSSYGAIKDEPESFGDSGSDKSLLHWNLCGWSGPWSLNDLSLLPCWYLRQKRRWQDPTFSFLWPQLGKYIFLFHEDKFGAIHLFISSQYESSWERQEY